MLQVINIYLNGQIQANIFSQGVIGSMLKVAGTLGVQVKNHFAKTDLQSAPQINN